MTSRPCAKRRHAAHLFRQTARPVQKCRKDFDFLCFLARAALRSAIAGRGATGVKRLLNL